MKELHKANRQQYEKHQQSREDSTKAIERLEGSSGGIGEQYKFLQEMRGYVQDLLECFSEKVRMQKHSSLFKKKKKIGTLVHARHHISLCFRKKSPKNTFF